MAEWSHVTGGKRCTSLPNVTGLLPRCQQFNYAQKKKLTNFKSCYSQPLWQQDSGNCMIAILRAWAAPWLKKSTWLSRSTIGAWPSRIYKWAAGPLGAPRGNYGSHFKTPWLSAGRGLCTSSRIQWPARYWGESDYNNTLFVAPFFTFAYV